jgi:hypothetical protein
MTLRARLLALPLTALLSLAVSSARGDEPADALGFADAPSTTAVPTEVPPSKPSGSAEASASRSRVHLSGQVGVQTAVRLERKGASRLGKARLVFAPRLELGHDFGAGASLTLVASARAEADFAYLLRPNAYDAATMALYGAQLIMGETYVQWARSDFELTLGEQIVNFGQGDVLSLLDVVNPRDLREPLFADLDELRLPVLMTRAALTLNRLRIELLVVHEPFFGLVAPPLGEFSPLQKLLADVPRVGPALDERDLRYRHVPGRDPTQFDAAQLHLRVALRVSQADLSLQASSVLDPLGIPAFPALEQLLAPRIDLRTYHPRYTLLGQAGVVSVGAFVLRWELGAEIERTQLMRRRGTRFPELRNEKLTSLRTLLGATYVPNARTSLAFEALQSVVLQNPARRESATHELLFPLEAVQLALRFSQQFASDRAAFTLVLLCIGVTEFNAFAARGELSYALSDALRAALGGVSYLPSTRFGPFYGFERHDRVYLNLRWSFVH